MHEPENCVALATAVGGSEGSAILNKAFPAGGDGMGAAMRAHDWSASPLGDPATWPQPLRSAVSLILESRFLMFVA